MSKEQPKVECIYDEMVELPKLKPHPLNPNTHPDEQIERLAIIIKYQGWRERITVSKRSGFIIKGHARLKAAEMLGCKTVPVEYQNYENEAAEWADMIADNKIAELAITDGLKMADILVQLDELNFNLDLTGMDTEEIKFYIDGPGFEPDDTEQPRLDQLDPIMVKCPKCGDEFDSRKAKITD